MNITKKIVLLALAAQLLPTAAVLAKASYEYVAINRQELLQKSKQGKKLQEEIQQGARDLQMKQQSAVNELQQEERKFQKEAPLLSKTEQQQRYAKLKKKSEKMQRELQDAAAEFEENAKFAQQELDAANLDVARELALVKGWKGIQSMEDLLFASADINVTDQVLAKLDANYDAEQATLLAQATAANQEVQA
ncbi:MAG: hypothetical protein QG604_562 [Candidatus Dependentiae bacterium]|nr:hypothetical protein [Candidatus Dependentiae bacterium]